MASGIGDLPAEGMDLFGKRAEHGILDRVLNVLIQHSLLSDLGSARTARMRG